MSSVEQDTLKVVRKLSEKVLKYVVAIAFCSLAFVITMVSANLICSDKLAHNVIFIAGFLYGLPVVYYLSRSLFFLKQITEKSIFLYALTKAEPFRLKP